MRSGSGVAIHPGRPCGNGFDDGWEYGAWIQYESSFQEGFADGFDQAVWTAADESSAWNWNRSFEQVYEVAFDRWNRSVRTGILDVRLEDGDQDGVFEPGETILVFYELANYGGESESVRLLVARPLQFQDGWQIDGRAALDGIAIIELQVVNRSRRPVSGEVRMESVPGTESSAIRELGRMPAGEERTMRFRLTGLDPLDIISGDLSRDDLLSLMVRMAGDRTVPDPEIRRVRDLVMSRMRADWRIASRGRRNPYKKDFKSGVTGTALGELVRTIDRLPAGLSRSEVFLGLKDDLAVLSGELPGAHPFLRKWFRKLARRIA